MSEYKILPRSEVEKLVEEWIDDKKIYATYGKDDEGLFQVNFIVKESN
jgi:hypothetical protein